MLVTNFMSADEYVRWIDHNTYIILIHQSYRITRMYKWEHEWSTSYLYFHALTHTQRTLCIWTASMSYDHVSTYPKADIDNNWSFARKFQAFNDFHCCQDHWVLQKCQLCWSKHRWGLSVLSCPKILPKTVKQPFGTLQSNGPINCLTQLCRLTFCQRQFVVMGNYALTKPEVWKSIMIFCNSVQHYFCQLYPEMQLTHIKSELIGDLTCQTLKLKLRN